MPMQYPPKDDLTVERMLKHIMENKRIPLVCKTEPVKSLSKLIPSEKVCTHCNQGLSESMLLKKGRWLQKEAVTTC